MTKHTAIHGLSNLIAAFAVGTTQHDASVEWSREALGVLAQDDCLALAKIVRAFVNNDRGILNNPSKMKATDDLEAFIKDRS